MGKKEEDSKGFAITCAQGIQSPSSAKKYNLGERDLKAGAPHEGFLNAFDRFCEHTGRNSIIQSVNGSSVYEIEAHEDLRKRDDFYIDSPRLRRLLSQRQKEREQRKKTEEWNLNHPNKEPREPSMHFFWEDIPSKVYKTLDDLVLHKKITLSRPRVPSQNDNPLSGQRDLCHDFYGTSVIIPHPKQRFEAVPKDVGGKLPRLIATTGACTYPNYNITNDRGDKANRRHQIGFCIADILDKHTYLIRLVPAAPDGSFVDLGVLYGAEKDPKRARTKALILGDIHVPFQDPLSMKASYEQIEKLKPEEIYLHDLITFNSIAHHNLDDFLQQVWLTEMGGDFDDLKTEVYKGFLQLREIAEIAGNSTVYVVPSNHDMFLHKWLAQGADRKDRKNARFGSEIFSRYHQGDSVLEIALNLVGKIPKNVVFLKLTDDKRPFGYECSCHGHQGINGSKGSLDSFRVSYGKGVMGHTHRLEVQGRAISVGTNSIIPMEYQRGQPSQSMHGNAAIYELKPGYGLAQAIPIIRGKWKAK
ncbi:MAG: hypothetical protein NC918_07155 [Candidatus Omnitrophica bacterium]|nr:hypothetical protein [Candidatus Omnitrophota bacterium]